MPQPQIIPQQQQNCNPLNEFDDLDFNGMASLLGQMNQPLGPEVLFDENYLLPQMSFNDSMTAASSSTYAQPADDRQFYNAYTGIYFNPHFMP